MTSFIMTFRNSVPAVPAARHAM